VTLKDLLVRSIQRTKEPRYQKWMPVNHFLGPLQKLAKPYGSCYLTPGLGGAAQFFPSRLEMYGSGSLVRVAFPSSRRSLVDPISL